jgi:hypothetical protein
MSARDVWCSKTDSARPAGEGDQVPAGWPDGVTTSHRPPYSATL